MKFLVDMGNILHGLYMKNYFDFQKNGFDMNDLEEEVTINILDKFVKLQQNFSVSSIDDFILCFDNSSWRLDVFPYYKKTRRDNRDKTLDSKQMYKYFRKIKKILYNLGFTCLSLEKCEADDIIGVLTAELKRHEHIIIIAKDKDFLQLIDKNVVLYDPFIFEVILSKKLSKKEEIKIETKKDADVYKMLHILNGDVSDGIPNVLSDDDAICNPLKKQKRLGFITIKKMMDDKEKIKKFISDNYDNFKRNARLIIFDSIPKNIQESILTKYSIERNKHTLDKELTLSYNNKYDFKISRRFYV